MKKSLGKILFIFLILITYVHATPLATYKISTNKTAAYEKEAVLITFHAQQKDYTDNMMFSLEPKKSNAYKIILLHKKIDDTKRHHSQVTFSYLLFPLKTKTIYVNFNFTIRTASDKAVANSYIDDHDDSIAIQTKDTKINIEPLKIHVTKLQKPVELVGDFILQEHIDKTKIDQFGSVNIIYTLKGKGYADNSFQPIKQIKNVTVFSETNNILNKPSSQGYIIKKEYIYALSAKKSFTIPSVSVSVFSPKTQKYYTLNTKQHFIDVKKVDTAKLIDHDEYPNKDEFIDIEKIKQFFIYIIIFFTGYISAKFQISSFKRNVDSKILTDIKNSKTPKTLLFTLINNHLEEKFLKESQMLEEMVYNNTKYNFQKLKRTIVKELK